VCTLLTVGFALLARLVAVEPGREVWYLINGGETNRHEVVLALFLGARGCLRNLFKFTLWANSKSTLCPLRADSPKPTGDRAGEFLEMSVGKCCDS